MHYIKKNKAFLGIGEVVGSCTLLSVSPKFLSFSSVGTLCFFIFSHLYTKWSICL